MIVYDYYVMAEEQKQAKWKNERMGLLTRKMKKFSPDLGISFCSPDAARVTFGLGVKHIAFSDMPHARIQMKLTIPLC